MNEIANYADYVLTQKDSVFKVTKTRSGLADGLEVNDPRKLSELISEGNILIKYSDGSFTFLGKQKNPVAQTTSYAKPKTMLYGLGDRVSFTKGRSYKYKLNNDGYYYLINDLGHEVKLDAMYFKLYFEKVHI